MSTLCPYSITKGNDGLSVKVEWDVHYLTDEQLEMVRSYVETLQDENAELRELVRDMCVWAYIDSDCDLDDRFADRMRELGIEVDE